VNAPPFRPRPRLRLVVDNTRPAKKEAGAQKGTTSS
jgi:hypothetical protein